MLNYIKKKLMKFSSIFKDENTADIITGFSGKDLPVQEFIYNSFVIITLGCFGIDGITKIFKTKKEE